MVYRKKIVIKMELMKIKLCLIFPRIHSIFRIMINFKDIIILFIKIIHVFRGREYGKLQKRAEYKDISLKMKKVPKLAKINCI